MAFDGAFLYALRQELNICNSASVDKIYQPSKDILLFYLRSKSGNYKLYISAKPGRARINFTDEKTENPESPPMFCMLLRKHLTGAKISGFYQNGFERVLEIRFTARNEMGDTVTEKLYLELIGNSTNIVFTDENNRIFDAVRRSTIEKSGRIILPGAEYELPLSYGKTDLLKGSNEEIVDAVFKNTSLTLSKSLLMSVNGLSPLICREIAENVCGDSDKPVSSLTKTDKMNLEGQIAELKKACLSPVPIMLYDENDNAVDFTFTSINQYGKLYKNIKFNSFSELLNKFYSEKDKSEILHKAQSDILKKLTATYSKIQKRLALRLGEIEAAGNSEHLRIYGELIKANIYNIEEGASFCRVLNYYSENGEFVYIKLDPTLSAAKNSAKYFKEYKKSHSAKDALLVLTQKDKEELSYIDTVFDELARATSVADIKSIREELHESGLIKGEVKAKKSKKQAEVFKSYSYKGYTITVGKNNKQNDLITLKMSDKNDIWLHVKDSPGSHTVISAENTQVPQEVIIYAAKLAAENSKLADGSNRPVDYTKIRYVKKPSGAKPGMVIYTNQKTLYI